jgi:GrpB-like predicted nucleotidyltransferase (UPF0157 family)
MRDLLELTSSAPTAEVMNRCVLFREYEVSWPQLYEAEKALVLGQIGEHLLAIEHIGSTAVPGLSAKPIIDMLLGVETLEQADACLDPLEQLGYEYLPERTAFTKARRFLRKYPLGGPVGYHLHLLQPSNPYWTVLLAFRNYLRHHPATAQRYSVLKQQLAEQFPTDRLAYLHGKADFIHAVLQEAEQESFAVMLRR